MSENGLTQAAIEEIRARWERVTAGKWQTQRAQNEIGDHYVLDDRGAEIAKVYRYQESTDENTTAIASAPDDVRELLAEVERLRGALEAIAALHSYELDEAYTLANNALATVPTGGANASEPPSNGAKE